MKILGYHQLVIDLCSRGLVGIADVGMGVPVKSLAERHTKHLEKNFFNLSPNINTVNCPMPHAVSLPGTS